MHRNKLLGLLAGYADKFPAESTTVQELELFVRDNERCFERSLKIGHITGSAWIVNHDFSKTLLTHHRKLDKWFQPGGHADGDNNIERVAMREALEESGLAALSFVHGEGQPELFDIDIHSIPARGSEPRHFHYDCRFLIRCTGSEDYVVSEESHDLAWIALTQVTDLTDEQSILRMIEKTPAAE